MRGKSNQERDTHRWGRATTHKGGGMDGMHLPRKALAVQACPFPTRALAVEAGRRSEALGGTQRATRARKGEDEEGPGGRG